MERTSLILEGGGMRGAFTAGVLDLFLDKDLLFRDVYGVSAGACQACSYLCRQRGRAIKIWMDYCQDKRFCSFSSLIKTGDLFNADFNYHQIPEELIPIDNAAYHAADAHFYVVVTNIGTGQAEYLPVYDMLDDVAIVQASSSLPLVSRPVEINGQRYLDGGIADSIPLARAKSDGYIKHVMVLTQASGYRKTPNKAMPLIARKYKAYPGLVNTLRNRHTVYNDTLDLIEAEREEGRAFIIQPPETPNVGRIEHDPKKLKALYQMGYETAEKQFETLLSFLKE